MLKKIKGYFVSYYQFDGATKLDKWLFWLAMTIMTLSMIPRFFSIDWFLPIYSIDENELVEFAIGYFGGDMDPHWYKYGAFYSYILHYIYNIQIMFGSMSEDEFVQSAFVDCSHLYYTARFVNSLLHLGMAFITYEITKQLFSKRTALVVFAIACFPILGLLTNFTIRVDSLLAFWSTCTLYYVVRMAKEPKLKYYILAGIFVGFGIASKPLPGILILPTVFFGHVAGYLMVSYTGKKNFNYYLGLLMNPKVFALPAAAFVGNFIGNPYSILNLDGFWAETEKIIKEEGGYDFVAGWDVTRFFNITGEAFTVFAFLLIFYGVARGIKKKDWVSLLPASYAIIFWVIFSFGAARNYFYIPIFLVLVMYIGVAINDLVRFLESRLEEKARFGVITACVVLLLAQPSFRVVSEVVPRSFIDADTEYSVLAAKNYMQDEVNGKSSVVFAGFYTSHPRVVLGEIGNYGLGSRKLNGNVWGDYFMYGRGNNQFLIDQFQKWHNGYLASGEPRFDNAVYYKLLNKDRVLDVVLNAKAEYLVTTSHLDLASDQFFKSKLIKKFEKGEDGVKQGAAICIYKLSKPELMVCEAPETAYDYYWNSIIQSRLGQVEQAKNSLEQAIEIDPEHKGALVNLGTMYANQRKFKESVVYFEKVLDVDEKNLNVMANLGRSYFYLKDYKKSVDVYNGLLELKSDYTDGYIMNCQSQLALGDTAAALAELGRAEKAVPSAFNVFSQKALVLQKKGDFTEALVNYRKAYGLNSGDLQSISSAYSLATRINDVQGMLSDLNAFIAVQPNNGQLYLARGNVFERLGNKDKACEEYANAQKLGDQRAVTFRSRLCF